MLSFVLYVLSLIPAPFVPEWRGHERCVCGDGCFCDPCYCAKDIA